MFTRTSFSVFSLFFFAFLFGAASLADDPVKKAPSSQQIFQERREAFFTKLEALGCDFVAIIPAHSEQVRNSDVFFKFRQDSNFFYLTGFEEPDAVAVFSSTNGKREYMLFVRPKDPTMEMWVGKRCGVQGAIDCFGANKAYSVDEITTKMPKIAESQRLYFDFFVSSNRVGTQSIDQQILNLIQQSSVRSPKGAAPVLPLEGIIGEMRLYKSASEIEMLRTAARISTRAHNETMARTRPGLYEYQIEGLFDFACRESGCARQGYPSIVGSGPNATTLHHTENDRLFQDGDLLLIDAAGEYGYYSADVTRTYPVNGKWTPAQAKLYDIVLATQKECIKLAKPGVPISAIHDLAVERLTEAFISLGFLKGDKADLIKNRAYRQFFPHGTDHWLGLDVHDAGGYYGEEGKSRLLAPGMALAIEPGIYISKDDQSVPEEYRGIGIRIEDNVLITADGNEVLTSDTPKERDEISALVGTKPWVFTR